jgi:hypothetical protein
MSLSTVGICNLALGWLGANLITAIDEDSNEAKLCNATFEHSRDACLEDYDWSFAMTRARLTPLTSSPAFGYSNAFQRPSDCVRITAASSSADFNTDTDWRIEEDTIVSDAGTLYIRYVKKITNTAKFTAGFTHALAAKLAADLAVPITGSREMQDLMYKMYEIKRDRAGTMDGLQGKNTPFKSYQLIDKR